MNRNTTFMLSVHPTDFSTEELVINPDSFPPTGAKPKIGDLIEITNIENQKKLYLPVKALPPVKGNLQVSIAKYIASVFDFQARRDVHVRVVTADQARVDFVELSFKDQYIGRSGIR